MKSYHIETNNKEYFSIPTKEEMRAAMDSHILKVSDKELYQQYDKTVKEIWEFGNIPDLLNNFNRDKELIKSELKNRGLKVPGWINKFKIWLSGNN